MTRHVWEGKWLEDFYVLKQCPLCGEKWTFRFYGNYGIWECINCKGNGDYHHLINKLPQDAKYENLFSDMEQPEDADGLIDVSLYKPPAQGKRISSGFIELDRITGGFTEGMLSILTGKQGEGKSTFSGLLALNAIDAGHKVCAYSGELNSAIFKKWIYGQAAGAKHTEESVDQFGTVRYEVSKFADAKISQWLRRKLFLYDNTAHKSSEVNSIIERFTIARRQHECDLFIVDNLMTAKMPTNNNSDFFRAQSNFVGELIDFAQSERVHVILVAHPKKEDTGDLNDNVGGNGDITRRSSIVMTMRRIPDEQYQKFNCNNILYVSKNREHGTTGKIDFNFDKSSKRLYLTTDRAPKMYGWERM